jgi:hypothetical protein
MINIPTGRRLEGPDTPPELQGTIGPFRPAEKERLRLPRRHLREIQTKDIEGQRKYLVERTSGESFEVLTRFVDLTDPKASGAEAFVVRDGLLVPLAPRGSTHGLTESHEIGSVGGGRVA